MTTPLASSAEMPVSDGSVSHHDGPSRHDITTLDAWFRGPIDIRSVALTGLFLIACLFSLAAAQAVFIPITTALILSILLGPVVRMLTTLKLPTPMAAAIVLAVLLGSVSSAGYLLVDPAKDWIAKAPDAFVALEKKLEDAKHSIKTMTQATAALEKMTDLEKAGTSRKVEIKGPSLGGTVFHFTKGVVASTVTTLILLYFLLAGGDFFLEKLVKVLPTLSDKKRAVDIVREIEHSVSHYLSSITIINLGVGIAVGCAMALLGMPNPILWGVAAGLLHFVPYLGSLTGLVMIALVALLTFDSLGWILLTIGTYWMISALEALVVTPYALGHRLTMNPMVILISLIFWGWLWGIPGVLLAVPILASLKSICDHIEPLHPVSEFLGR